MMEIKPLLRKLCVDFTNFYSHNKWVVYLLKVHWKPGVRVEENDFKILQPARLGVLGSYNKEYMHVQVIVEQRNIEYLIRWLRILLEKAELIVSYVSEWPGELRLIEIGLDSESLEILAGNREMQAYSPACEPFLLITEWLSLLLRDENSLFFFRDPLIHHDIYNIHLMYSPLFYLKQKENFRYFDFTSPKGVQPYKHFFRCSFSDWWDYPCFSETVVFHPIIYILNKIIECGLYYIIIELNDQTIFFEKLIRFGLNIIDIACTYTYQPPELRASNRLYLVIGYALMDLTLLEQMNSFLLEYLHDLKPTIVPYDFLQKKKIHSSYPNKVSRSIWTQDFKMCRLLCRRFQSVERDELGLDDSLSNIKGVPQPVSLVERAKRTFAHPRVFQDIVFMRQSRMDFIYIYKHHDPFDRKDRNNELRKTKNNFLSY